MTDLHGGFDRSWAVGTFGRALAFVLSGVVVHLLLRWEASATDTADANIGAGLALFAVWVLGSATWAGLDAARGVPLAPLLVRWGVVAVVTSLTSVLGIQVGAPGPINLDVLRSDLVEGGPFTAGLIALPAGLAALAGWALRAEIRRRTVSPPR